MFGLKMFPLVFLWSAQALDIMSPSVDIVGELDKLRTLEDKMKTMEAEMAELKTVNAGNVSNGDFSETAPLRHST